MAIRFNDAIKMAGGYPEKVDRILKYRAYKDGEVKTFDSLIEAKKFSKLTESFIENNDQVNAYWTKCRLVENQAYNIWKKSLRDEYPEFNDAVFDLVYDQAYDRYHSEGYDEVANGMVDLAEFALSAIKLYYKV